MFGLWLGSLAGAIYKDHLPSNLVVPVLTAPVSASTGPRAYCCFGGNVTAARYVPWSILGRMCLSSANRLGKNTRDIFPYRCICGFAGSAAISGIINQVAMPAFAKLQHDRELAGPIFRNGLPD